MQAMVLCAGYGTRLGDLTRSIPKPMLRVAGRPILEYILVNLVRNGFTQIGVNLHFLPEMIPAYFGDGMRWGCRLVYSHEPELLGTAGGARRLLELLGGNGPFLLHYGDILTNQSFTGLLTKHRETNAAATALVHRRAKSMSVLTIDTTGCVTTFLERPSEEERQGIESDWVFSGVALCSRELLETIPLDQASDLPRHLLAPLAGSGRLYSAPLTGDRIAIDSPSRYAEAEALAEQGAFAVNVG